MKQVCSIEGCQNFVLAKGMCKQHYMKKFRYGSPYAKTSRDLNDIEIKEEWAEIILTKSPGIEVARALIDIEDVERVKNIRWGFHFGYVVERVRGKPRRLHSFIMGDHYTEVDHIDGNRLDNRKKNLRKATRMQNVQNTPKRRNCKTNYKGVEKLSKGSRWRARITVEKQTINLGTYATEQEAAMAYDMAAMRYFGEFARLNFPSKRGEYRGLNRKFWQPSMLNQQLAR